MPRAREFQESLSQWREYTCLLWFCFYCLGGETRDSSTLRYFHLQELIPGNSAPPKWTSAILRVCLLVIAVWATMSTWRGLVIIILIVHHFKVQVAPCLKKPPTHIFNPLLAKLVNSEPIHIDDCSPRYVSRFKVSC